MLPFLVALALGVGALVWSAERFVMGASATARNFGVSPLVIGLTVVAVGTSAPEVLVSVMASLDGSAGLAIGNAVGSNIANIGLVLGITAVLAPLTVRSETLRREFPMMFVVMLIAGALIYDGDLGRGDGAILLGVFFAVVVVMLILALKARRGDPMASEFDDEIPTGLSTGRAVFWLVVGLLVLVLSSRVIVWAAVNVAQALGISDLLIGLTIIAIGTSLPELAASAAGALKNEPDIAIGNVIGSNMFNLLPVLCMPGLLAPGPIDSIVLERDYPVMFGLSVVLLLTAYGFRGPGRVTRGEGVVLLLAFAAYQFVLYRSAV